MELYRRHRPKKLADLVGQPETAHALMKALKDKNLPHAILLHGQKGCGKTSVARILRRELDCRDDYYEINAAESRGIDTIRDIIETAPLNPMFGTARMWVLDEFHMATRDAMTAALKLLEDPPDHAYFVLCTTDPEKLLPTIRSRCTAYALLPLKFQDMLSLLGRIASAEKLPVNERVLRRIVEVSDGSPRGAIVLLEKASKFDDEAGQLSVVEKSDQKKAARSLAQVLMDERSAWSDAAKVIEGIDVEPERVRQGVLAYAGSVLLNGKSGSKGGRAYLVLCAFQDAMFDSGKHALIRASWEVLGEK